MGDVRSGLWTSGALEFWFQCNALYALYLVICTFYPVTDVCSCSWGALLCGVPRLNKWTESHWWSYQTDRCLYNQLSCHLKRESCTTPWRKREGWSLESKYFVTECSGGSRGGARGARLFKVLKFRGRFEKSLNSIKVREKYMIPLLCLEKSLKLTRLFTPHIFCEIALFRRGKFGSSTV